MNQYPLDETDSEHRNRQVGQALGLTLDEVTQLRRWGPALVLSRKWNIFIEINSNKELKTIISVRFAYAFFPVY